MSRGRRSHDMEKVLAGVRKSVDIAELEQNDSVDVFYCNTVSPSTPQWAVKSSQHMGGGAGDPEEEFYINVKH